MNFEAGWGVVQRKGDSPLTYFFVFFVFFGLIDHTGGYINFSFIGLSISYFFFFSVLDLAGESAIV